MSEKTGYYQVKLIVKVDELLLGAPALHLTLGVNAATGHINGIGEITQPLPVPFGDIHLQQLTGQIVHTGLNGDTLLVHLHGDYFTPFTPPAIGSIVNKFSGALAVDANWQGHGTYVYGQHHIHAGVVEKVQA